jgi:hypothetical protein
MSARGTGSKDPTPLLHARRPRDSRATFNNTTRARLGFTTTGLIGTWTLAGTGDTINVVIVPPTAVPGPLPLFGAAAA